MRTFSKIETSPAYGPAEAARYLRLPADKAVRWAKALCTGTSDATFPISFVNLMELHVLKAMRLQHTIPMQRIRRAVTELQQRYGCAYPLLERSFVTDGLNLLMEEEDSIINLSRYSQVAIRSIVDLYVRRIEIDPKTAKLYPFVAADTIDEPRDVLISANLSFGRPVIAGTAISTEVVAARFRARESVTDLAAEYGVPAAKVEEAIRWELSRSDAA